MRVIVEEIIVFLGHYTQTCRHQILALFIVFEVLLHTYKWRGSWILVPTTLHTKVSNFLRSCWFGITKKKDCLDLLLGRDHTRSSLLPYISHTSGTWILEPSLPVEKTSYSWSCTSARDLKWKLAREVTPRKQMASWVDSSPKFTEQDLHLQHKNFVLFCSFATCFFSVNAPEDSAPLFWRLSPNVPIRP